MVKELITTSDIAEIANVTVQAVTNWKTRYKDFPKAIAKYRRDSLYNRDEVIVWLRQHEIEKKG